MVYEIFPVTMKHQLLRNLKYLAFSHIIIKSIATSSGEVLFETINNKGIITLNKPEKLNVVDFDNVTSILHKLIEWEKKVDMVIIRGEGKAFCAGGDIIDNSKLGPQGHKISKKFFISDYTMNGVIGHYPVPYLSLIHGVTMGSGVGLAVHGHFRVATENTLFAMPETIIGLFPDAGTSYVLSRMPHCLGIFLALTGHRLRGLDCVKAGIATHYTKSKNIPTIFNDLINMKEPHVNLNNYLLNQTDDVSNAEFSLNPYISIIDKCFSAYTVEEIFERLEDDRSEFANNTLNELKKKSPTSLKISRKLLEICKDKSLIECVTIDNRLAAAAVEARVSTDYYEGVRALLIDKDQNPKWNPPSLKEVKEEMVNIAFEKLSPEEELNFEARVDQLRKTLQKST